jgi:hypothetical protein
MPYNFLNATKDNLKHDIDLDLSPLKHQIGLNYDFITPNNNI